MKMTPTHQVYVSEPVLYMAFELSDKKWVLGFSNGSKTRQITVEALDRQAVLKEIASAKKKLGLPEDCRVISCYEAGWEGFWLARWLATEGIENYVLDSSAIETNRKSKSAKTDRIDAEKLLWLLLRFCGGEKKAISIVRVPSPFEEDERQLHRERDKLVKNRGSHATRINSLLRGQGLRWDKRKEFLSQLEEMRLWDGSALEEGLKSRLQREWSRNQLVDSQIKSLEKEQWDCIKASGDGEKESADGIRQLMTLKAVGPQTSWCLEKEFFSWRKFKNRREVGSLSGLTPMPYNSGESSREQGISKAGNKRVRAIMIELAWSWLRYQPQSQLSLWFEERFAKGGKRHRRVGIVALARKLLIQLWQYRETGVIPPGAELK